MRSILVLCALTGSVAACADAAATLTQAAGVVMMQQNAKIDVWVADSLDNIMRDAAPKADAPREITLAAARDEFESGQIVVRSDGWIRGLRATATALAGPDGSEIPGANLRCRFVGYVQVNHSSPSTPAEELVAPAPGQFPDVLLESTTVDVEPNQAQPVWLTVRVPIETVPGQYAGSVSLIWNGGKATVPVSLTVWPFAVPSERHLLFTNWFADDALANRYGVHRWSEEFWPIFERYVANCAAHRQNINWNATSTIRTYREEDGSLAFDFSVFDRRVEILERHGVADLIEFTPLGHFKKGWSGPEIALSNLWVTDRKTGEGKSTPAEEVLPHWLPALQEHLRERGWLEKTVIHVADEPSVHNVKSWREKSDWVHSLAPEIRRIDAIEGPDFGDSLEIWVPKLNHYFNWQGSYERARQRGAKMWFYTCCHPMGRYPNRYIDYPLIKTRILHWFNWRYNLTGYLHWGLIAWNEDPLRSADRSQLPPGDAWVVYPGEDGPLDSIRWEAVRDGIEDYEYLWLLSDLAARVREDLGDAADGFDPCRLADELCFEAVPGALDYQRDPAMLKALRARIAEEIVRLQSQPRLLAWTDPPAWQPVLGPPAGAILYVAAESGATVTINGDEVQLDETGYLARHLFLTPGEHTYTIAAEKNGSTTTAVRTLTAAQ